MPTFVRDVKNPKPQGKHANDKTNSLLLLLESCSCRGCNNSQGSITEYLIPFASGANGHNVGYAYTTQEEAITRSYMHKFFLVIWTALTLFQIFLFVRTYTAVMNASPAFIFGLRALIVLMFVLCFYNAYWTFMRIKHPNRNE